MDCSFRTTTGGNQQTINWRKDGILFRHLDLSKPSFEGWDHSRFSIDKASGALIFNYTLASDAGVYDCKVINNDDGSEISSQPAKLDVEAILKFLSLPKRKTLVVNMVTKMHCKAQGSPPPIVVWTKEGAGDALPDGVTVENGTLIFDKATFEHKGNYTCTASNSQGTITNTVTITVAEAPQ